MSEKEPWVPEAPPEEDSYRDPNPALCYEIVESEGTKRRCYTILQNVHPDRANRKVGWCPRHGLVLAGYQNQ